MLFPGLFPPPPYSRGQWSNDYNMMHGNEYTPVLAAGRDCDGFVKAMGAIVLILRILGTWVGLC